MPFYRSHGEMRLSVYSDLQGTDAIAFPLDGGAAAMLNIDRLNARLGNRELVEERVIKLMGVYRKHPNAFQPFLLVKGKLYGFNGQWVIMQDRHDAVIAAADDGERL